MIGMFLRQMSYEGRRMSYYAVVRGRKVGIYSTWDECLAQVNKYKNAVFKKFPTYHEAENFLKQHREGESSSSSYNPQDAAVPLGSKHAKPSVGNNVASTSKRTSSKGDFWPESNDFEAEEAVSEEDLLAAMHEVEGVDYTSAAKRRKMDSVIQNSKGNVTKIKSTVLEPAGIKTVGVFDFLIDDKGYVIVYTDGSCINNGMANAVGGFGVYFGDDHALNAAKPVSGRVTNNVGEIQAAIYAIKIATDLGIKKLRINTDSQFLIKSVTLWFKGWKRRKWRLANGEEVKNVVDFKELDELLETKDIDVKWNYVKSHCGIKGNEMADKLAREGAELYAARNKTN